jgi:hypothetical protein
MAQRWSQRADNTDYRSHHAQELRRVLDHPNSFGATPLWLAASKGHADVCRVLLEHGARANTSTRSDMSALHVALISGHRAVVAVLLAYGADVTSRLMLEAKRLDDAATGRNIAVDSSSPTPSLLEETHPVLLPSSVSLPILSTSASTPVCQSMSAVSNPAWAALLAEAHALHSISGGEADGDDGGADDDDASAGPRHGDGRLLGVVDDVPFLQLPLGHRRSSAQRRGSAGGTQEWVTVFGAWGMTAYVGMLLVALVARILLA